MNEMVLITGASGGIGKSVAKKLAKEGYSLYLQYNRGENEIKLLCDELSQFPITIHTIQADLSNRDEVLKLLEMMICPIDHIVYCAGNSYVGLLTDMSFKQIDDCLAVHVTSLIHIVNGLLPHMIHEKRGNIIVISSIWGEVGASCEVVYSTVKGGQNTFVKSLAKELAPTGIRVNAIAPGAIKTSMMSGFSDEEITQIENEIPMGRLGQASEVADSVSFLLSNQASYITGHILQVNGGWS